MEKHMYDSMEFVQVFLSPSERGCSFEIGLAMASIQQSVCWTGFVANLYVIKYVSTFLDDNGEPFRTAILCMHNLEGTFLNRCLV